MSVAAVLWPAQARTRAAAVMGIVALAWAAISLAVSACGGTEPTVEGRQPWQGTSVTEGNVTTVRTEGGSVWQGSAELVEELSIGEEVGEEPYMFGRVSAVGATDDRIYALDEQMPVVRVYDQEGVHMLDIGRGGQGPGEFERPTAMALDALGNVYVQAQGEIEVFSPDGEHIDTWSLDTVMPFTWFDTANVGLDGTAYVPVILERQGMNPFAFKVGYVELREGVEGNTRPLPEFDYETQVVSLIIRTGQFIAGRPTVPPFVPRRTWGISPRGSIVSGSGDEYRFEVHHADGTAMVIEKVWDAVPVQGAEGAWYRDLLRADCAGADEVSGWDPDSMLPTHKPAFEQLLPDGDGRIWVVRSGPGIRLTECNENPSEAGEYREQPCWIESPLLDVFDEQGRYLGAVEVPAEFSGLTPRIIQPRPFFRDDIMIAAVEDELGIISVKRYRLELPS